MFKVGDKVKVFKSLRTTPWGDGTIGRYGGYHVGDEGVVRRLVGYHDTIRIDFKKGKTNYLVDIGEIISLSRKRSTRKSFKQWCRDV